MTVRVLPAPGDPRVVDACSGSARLDGGAHRPYRRVIGVGNPTRGDDIAGRLVVRHLSGMGLPDVCLTEMDGDAASLVPALRADEAVWLIDASFGGRPAGTITRFDCAAGDIPPADASASSHGLGVAVAVALARALGGLPRHCLLYAIEGEDFAPGAPPSAAVTRAAAELAERIAAEVPGTAAFP